MLIMSFKKATQSWLGKALLIMLLLAMIGGFGISKIFSSFFKGSFEGVALVNTTDIPKQYFLEVVKEEEQRLTAIRQKYGAAADMLMQQSGMSTDPQAAALLKVVYEALMQQLVAKMNITVSQEYIESKLANPQFLMKQVGHILPPTVFLQDGTVDVHAVIEFLKQAGVLGAVEQQLAKDLSQQFAILMVQSGFFIPSFLIKQAYVEQYLGKKFSYEKFELATFLRKAQEVKVSDEALKAFYNEQNKTGRRYWNQERRSGISWTFSAQDYGTQVTQHEIEQYYAKQKSVRFVQEPMQVKVREIVLDTLKEQGTKALREQAEEVYAKAVAHPDSFADLAKEYSTHKETASKGGLVEFFKRSSKDQEYERAAFKLKENGEISPVVATEKGFVILQRVERKEATFKPLQDVKAEIVKIVSNQKFKSDFTRQANQLNRQDNPEAALKAFVQEHKGSESALNNQEKKSDTSSLLIQRLFAIRNDGDVIAFVEDGKGIIIQLTKKIKAEPAGFDKVSAAVLKDYHTQQAAQSLEKAVEQAKTESRGKQKLVVVEGATIHATEMIKGDDTAAIEKLVKQGFPEGFMQLDWQGAVLSSFSEEGAVVIRLDEVEAFNEADFKDKEREVKKQVFERSQTLFTQAFIASLFRTATIKVDDNLSRVKDQL